MVVSLFKKLIFVLWQKISQFTGALVYLLNGFHMLELLLLLSSSLHCCISNFYFCNMCNCFRSGSNITPWLWFMYVPPFLYSVLTIDGGGMWNELFCDIWWGSRHLVTGWIFLLTRRKAVPTLPESRWTNWVRLINYSSAAISVPSSHKRPKKSICELYQAAVQEWPAWAW